MIRHGKPSSSWGQDGDADPGLDAAGRVQAETAADALMALPTNQRPTQVFSSPLRRCRETAQPLADRLGVAVQVDARFGEIPTPAALAHEQRQPWLRKAFGGLWSEIDGDLDYDQWRRSVAEAVSACGGGAVFSHFVAINAATSWVTGEARVVSFTPDHASITVFEAEPGALTLVERGREADTGVL